MSVYYLLLPAVGVAADINPAELVRMAVLEGRNILEWREITGQQMSS